MYLFLLITKAFNFQPVFTGVINSVRNYEYPVLKNYHISVNTFCLCTVCQAFHRRCFRLMLIPSPHLR